MSRLPWGARLRRSSSTTRSVPLFLRSFMLISVLVHSRCKAFTMTQRGRKGQYPSFQEFERSAGLHSPQCPSRGPFLSTALARRKQHTRLPTRATGLERTIAKSSIRPSFLSARPLSRRSPRSSSAPEIRSRSPLGTDKSSPCGPSTRSFRVPLMWSSEEPAVSASMCNVATSSFACSLTHCRTRPTNRARRARGARSREHE
jgi:hypothetical protein